MTLGKLKFGGGKFGNGYQALERTRILHPETLSLGIFLLDLTIDMHTNPQINRMDEKYCFKDYVSVQN